MQLQQQSLRTMSMFKKRAPRVRKVVNVSEDENSEDETVLTTTKRSNSRKKSIKKVPFKSTSNKQQKNIPKKSKV